MKNHILRPRVLNAITLASLLTLTIAAAGQNTWIANSSPGAIGGPNVFTGAGAINDAIAAAANGDIIYVVPSGITYSTPRFDGKQVNLFGAGFNPTNASGTFSSVAAIYLNASNVRISGLVVNTEINIPGIFSNIMIDNCRLTRISDGSGGSAKANFIIQNCVIGHGNSGSASILIGNGSTNIRITNNLIFCSALNPHCVAELDNTIMENNVLVGTTSATGGAAFSQVVNSEFRNNIFYAVRPSGISTFTGNTFQNNLSFDASDNAFPTVNNVSANNIEGQDPLFVNAALGNTYIVTHDYHLQTGSPALGAGLGGTDMGIYGGLTPFDDHGSALPVVQALTAPAVIGQGSNLSVQIKAEGN